MKRISADAASPVDQVRVDEALAAARRLRRQAIVGQRRDDLRREPERVDELAGRLPGVNLDPGDADDRLVGAERLVLKLAEVRAIDRVRAERAKTLDVEQLRALADLLVRRERDPQGRSGEFRVRHQVRHGGHDRGHARLVIGAEQRVAARGDDVVTALLGQLGHRRRVKPRAAAWQLDHAAVVIAVDDRLDAVGRCIGARVDVRDQPDRGSARRTRECRGDVAVVVQRCVVEADLLKLGGRASVPSSSCPGVLGERSRSRRAWVPILA